MSLPGEKKVTLEAAYRPLESPVPQRT